MDRVGTLLVHPDAGHDYDEAEGRSCGLVKGDVARGQMNTGMEGMERDADLRQLICATYPAVGTCIPGTSYRC